MWESRVLQRAFERLELHEGKLSRAVLRGGGGGDVTSLPDRGGSNTSLLPGRSVDGSSQWGRVCARPDPAGLADGGRTVASESGGSGVWRMVVSGTRTVASEIEEAETTVIEKRPNKANLPLMLTIGRL